MFCNIFQIETGGDDTDTDKGKELHEVEAVTLDAEQGKSHVI